jgi:predicted PolB exonuclease-like 3'-5' exonuclease
VDRSYLILDIETIPDPSMPWDAARDGFPPPPHHQVVAVGVLWLDAGLRFKRMGVFGGSPKEGEDPEAGLLHDFARFLGKERCHLVTYNGRSFDLPVLINRCLRHGVSFYAYFHDRDYRYRYSDHGHIDLADLLAEHGAAQRSKLSSVASLLGMPGELPVTGSMVANLYREGDRDSIEARCLQDVVRTTFLFLRYELLRGRVDRPMYSELATELWDAVFNDPRVEPVFGPADRARVLLE